MGRKGKGIGFELKLEAVEKYLSGQGSQRSIASEYGIERSTFRQWIGNYEAMGSSGLIITSINKRYSGKFENKSGRGVSSWRRK